MSETVKAESTTKKSFFKRVKSEFKKVTWPKKDDLIKQTALVVVISIILHTLAIFGVILWRMSWKNICAMPDMM